MIVFLVIGLITALLHVALFESLDLVGTAIAYAVGGSLCGLVLRTRLEGGVARALVVCFSAIAFALMGPFDLVSLVAPAPLDEHVTWSALLWGLAGLFSISPFLGWSAGAPVGAVFCFAAAAGLARFVVFSAFDVLPGCELWLNPLLICTLGAGVFDLLCASIGLESPQRGFARLRVSLEFRLR